MLFLLPNQQQTGIRGIQVEFLDLSLKFALIGCY